MDIIPAYWELGKKQIPYLQQYTYDQPLIMSLQTYEKCNLLGMILHKAIRFFVAHYADFLHLMPLSERDLQVLEIASAYPFRTGTYRTDFVLDQQNAIKIIEMTTRQPLNGYVISGFTHALAVQMAQQMGVPGVVDTYGRLLQFMQNDLLKSGKVTVIKGKERLGDHIAYSQWFALAGIDYQVVELEALPQSLDKLHQATVIEELNHVEICAMPDALIHELCAAGIFNDFRNLFLIHDKRFFCMLTQPAFLDKILSTEEQAFLARYLVPTYTYLLNPEKFEQARQHPSQWILKSVRFGKSEGIYAGCVTPKSDWEALFSSKAVRQMVLQPMVDQATFSGTITGSGGTEVRNDFVAGTLLYCDEEFYGPGIYRASSFQVTNVKDDRKIAQLVAEYDERFASITL